MARDETVRNDRTSLSVINGEGEQFEQEVIAALYQHIMYGGNTTRARLDALLARRAHRATIRLIPSRPEPMTDDPADK